MQRTHALTSMAAHVDEYDAAMGQPPPQKKRKTRAATRTRVLRRTLIPFAEATLSSAPSEDHFQISSENRNRVSISDLLTDVKGDPAYRVRAACRGLIATTSNKLWPSVSCTISRAISFNVCERKLLFPNLLTRPAQISRLCTF